jgi:hypothetical protein
MPKLGLGLNLSGASSASTKVVTLYEDSFVSGSAGFNNRQFFSSGVGTDVTWGSGVLQNITSAANRQLLVYFDCLKDQYPTYSSTASYNNGAIVYGGVNGHALFQRTASGSGNPGAPNFLFTPSGTQDANGWTRHRPTLRTIQAGKTLTFNIKFRAISPGTIGANAFRFAVLDSTIGGTKTYVNADNLGLSNTLYGGNGVSPGYRGYMSAFAVSNQKILTRILTTNNSLVNTVSLVWEENILPSLSNLSLDTTYQVILKINRPTSSPSSLIISSTIAGGTVTGQGGILFPTITYTDIAPSTFSFDTFVAYTTSTACTALQLFDAKATYG